MDVNASDTLQYMQGKDEKDEKHITPTQLEVWKRCLTLWSNPNDLVFTPFMGIGSEVWQAVKMGRRGLGFELKESYYEQAKKNLESLMEEKKQMELF
jgi:DNA modification methylase